MASKDAIKREAAQRIVVFNHKGGVGKTTLTVNVAAAMAALGKRVLLVDADPQCNLSSYLLEENVLDDLLDHSDDPNGRTIWSAVQPVSEGIGEVRNVSPLELSIPNMFLLVGDIRLSEFEQELWILWNDCIARKVRGFRGTSSISVAVNHICASKKIDYVFYDCGPNIGVLNKVIVLDCDWFIVPAACDLFSLRALKTLGLSLHSWINDWSTYSSLAPDGLYVLPGRPRFLGYIPQRFKVYRGQVSSGYASYMARIERRVNSAIVNRLRKISHELASTSLSENKLGEVKDFATIANESQVQGVPMKDVHAGTQDQRSEAHRAFNAIAKRIIARTSAQP
jgi:cellulose biosynthesis protein BcsQ